MWDIIRKSVLTIIFGTLLVSGVYQTYYIFVPQNIAYGLKKEGYELSAYSEEARKNEYFFLRDKVVSNQKKQPKIEKPENLIMCMEGEKPKTNYIAYCKNLYLKPLSNKKEFESAKNWCAHKPTSK